MNTFDDMLKEKEIILFIMELGLTEIEACIIINNALYNGSLAKSYFEHIYDKKKDE